MYTVHLGLSGMIHDLRLIAENKDNVQFYLYPDSSQLVSLSSPLKVLPRRYHLTGLFFGGRVISFMAPNT
jgi:hypothetical protein